MVSYLEFFFLLKWTIFISELKNLYLLLICFTGDKELGLQLDVHAYELYFAIGIWEHDALFYF